jgi:small subunit ribosomal protein S3
MGQKINPHGMRVGVIHGWDAKWYADKRTYAKYIKEDDVIRRFIKNKYYEASISKIVVERKDNKLIVDIHTARPGVLIGKAGAGIEEIKKELGRIVKTENTIVLNAIEVRKPDIDAQLIAEGIAAQLEKRISFRRAMRQYMGRAMRAGAKGIKTMVSGRLDGAEIARVQQYHEGSIPLHTLRADIDYGYAVASTTFGVIGVKVWVFKGEILPAAKKAPKTADREGGNA